jgi:hypothetical protein
MPRHRRATRCNGTAPHADGCSALTLGAFLWDLVVVLLVVVIIGMLV